MYMYLYMYMYNYVYVPVYIYLYFFIISSQSLGNRVCNIHCSTTVAFLPLAGEWAGINLQPCVV